MALVPGARLGVYEVVGRVGAGGMGEVYRGRDARLNRDVALKTLLDLFVADPERLARFKREAQLLALLNHSNIAGIYGFEESNSVQALVLEWVDGPTLADRIAQGPVALDDAMPIAMQIAAALEAAHEQGIVHRDLEAGQYQSASRRYGESTRLRTGESAGGGCQSHPMCRCHQRSPVRQRRGWA